jgi:hypothetical protein
MFDNDFLAFLEYLGVLSFLLSIRFEMKWNYGYFMVIELVVGLLLD